MCFVSHGSQSLTICRLDWLSFWQVLDMPIITQSRPEQWSSEIVDLNQPIMSDVSGIPKVRCSRVWFHGPMIFDRPRLLLAVVCDYANWPRPVDFFHRKTSIDFSNTNFTGTWPIG